MRNFIIPFLILAVAACQVKETQEVEVKVTGALIEIMHQGKIGATIDTDTLSHENLFGLGAAEALSGEILILNGVVYHAFVSDSIAMVNRMEAKASLLVYAHVQKWDTLKVSEFEDVSELIKEKLPDGSFPFLLIGSPASVKYHVINYDSKITDISNHKEGAFRGEFNNEAVTILGFYSTEAKGIYTHHDSDAHMHVITADGSMMGHVDELETGDGEFNLLIPRQ